MGLSFHLKAQDVHFSQFWASSVGFNPALTGVFEGQFRATAQYRNQWFMQRAFSTYALSADANLFQNKLNGNAMGVGLQYILETEGKNNFQNTQASLSWAFQKTLGVQKKQWLGLGFQFSYIQKQINLQNAIYGNLYETNLNYDPIQTYNYNNTAFADMGLGMLYSIKLDKESMLQLGFSATHLLQPNSSFASQPDDLLYRKWSYFVLSKVAIPNTSFSLLPTLFAQHQGPHFTLNMGTYVKYQFTKTQNVQLGLQYRLASHYQKAIASDALIIGARTLYKFIDLGISYDITLSALRTTHAFIGAPELAFTYILATKHKTNYSLCPQF